MAHRRSLWLAVGSLVFGVTLAACGSSSGTTSTIPGATSVATPATPAIPTGPAFTAASGQCPTGAKVGAALGITLPDPVSIPGGGGPLPGGATGVSCEYHAATYNVLIEMLSNIDPTYISQFSSKFPVAYQNVPSVGDQARSFYVPLNGGKDNEGVVATKGRNLVNIVATATPASLAQLEDLVRQLL